MEEERKQLSATDAQERLTVIKHKIAFLHDAITPASPDKESLLDIDYCAAEGLGSILRDIETELQEITDAKIVTGVANG